MNGPRIGARPEARRPDAERAALLLALEVVGQDGQRAGHEQRAGRALEEPGEDEQLEVGREAAQHRGAAEADQADDEHRAAGRSSRIARRRG